MTDTIIMRGAYAITDPRLGASGVIPAGAVVIIDGIIRETGPFDAIVPKYPGADILVTASAQPTRHLPAWPPIILTRHRPLFEQVQLHLAANGLRIARGTIVDAVVANGDHQCTVLDQEFRQGARSRDASDKEGKPVVFSVCSLVRTDVVAKPTGIEPESSVARYSAMSS